MQVGRSILVTILSVACMTLMAAISVHSAAAQESADTGDDNATESEPRQIAVVTHPDNSVEELTRAELGRLFLKKRTFWENGVRCVPIDQPGSSEIRERFYQIVLDLDQTELKRYWMQETMTGNARPPVTVDNAAIVKKYIERLPGAVAYIWTDEVDETVKIVRVRDVPEFEDAGTPENASEDAPSAP